MAGVFNTKEFFMCSVRIKFAKAAVLGALCAATSAHAAGFLLSEQSSVLMGRAYAGAGVAGDDISGIFFNPASMTLFPGTQVQAGTTWVRCDFPYEEVDGSVRENGRLKGQAIPAGFINHQIADNLWIGLGITVPYGLGTDYGKNWKHSDKGSRGYVFTIDFNPNIAWKVNDYLSIGAGASAQYVKAILAYDVVKGINGRLDADGWKYSYNLGMMVKTTDKLRLGLSYRSAISHEADGNFKINGANGSTYAAMLSDTYMAAKGALKTPATAHASVAWDITPRWMLTGLVRWTQWSNFDKISIKTDATALSAMAGQASLAATLAGAAGNSAAAAQYGAASQALGMLAAGVSDMEIRTDWRDTWLFAIGADYKVNDSWTVRCGAAYETDPVDVKENLIATIPDQARAWFSVGATYRADKNWIVDAGLTYLKAVGSDAKLYSADRSQVVGTFTDSDAYIAGIQFQYRF